MGQGDWVDVEAVLHEGSNSLVVGQLAAIENFSLFDAMSAVEIGNPKMDASMTVAPLVNDLLDKGDAPNELCSGQVLAVVDQLLCMEATWHNGGSLAQTLYCCLYLLRPERAQGNVYLNAYCHSLRALSSEVRSLMFTGCVCEDEDFNPNAFGLPLEDTSAGTTAEKVTAAMSLAVERLQRITKLNSGKAAKQENQVSVEHMQQEHAPALLARLLFRQHFLDGVLCMLHHGKQDLSDAAQHFHVALAELETVRSTFWSGGRPEFGFHMHVNRHLLGPAPPRQCTIMSHDAALKYFETLLKHLSQACAVNNVSGYRQLQTFLEDFSSEAPSIVTRSLLHIQINHKTRDPNAPAFPWSPDQIMMCTCLNIPNKSDMPPDLAMFLEQCLIAVGNYCQAMLLNRARLRRRLRSGLVDWHNLWTHATNAEYCSEVQALLKERGWTWEPVDANGEEVLGPLALWVERETCYNMLLYLFLGMELQLYQPYEFVQIYWYCNYLLAAVISHMKKLQQWRPVPQPAAPTTPQVRLAQGGRKPGKGGKARRPPLEPPVSKTAGTVTPELRKEDVVLHHREVLVTEMHRFMSEGMMRLVLGLQQVGAVSKGPEKYNGEQERYDLRFGSFFQLVKPEPLPYDCFQSTTDCSKVSPDMLLTIASESFAQARRSAQILVSSTSLGLTPSQIAQIKAMDRVAMQNLVAGNVVKQALGQSAVLTATFNFSHHAFFPAVAVKRK